MTSVRGKVIEADLLHAPVRGELDARRGALIVVDAQGVISDVVGADEARARPLRDAAVAGDILVQFAKGTYLLPGLVDLHVHAPQYPQLGQALDVPLEAWLHTYTFPLEARYTDLAFARTSYTTLVEDLLAGGTTTALYFATVHRDATRLLVDICLDKGQRALVGKVVMDDPESCPDGYRDPSAAAAVDETRALIDYVRAHPVNAAGLVHPVITPRFIPSCTDAALDGLGRLAAGCGCHVQTHCSESDWAHGHVLRRFGRTDAASLDTFGLLTRRTVLAHANFLTDADMDLVEARGAGVAHCALSNAYFANSVFPLRQALDKAINVGLGTDVSGGPSASMFDAMRMTVAASRMLEDGVDPAMPADRRGRPGARIDTLTAFHLATAGGGRALDLPIGCFLPGYRFDAIAVDTTLRAGTIRLFGDLAPLDMLGTIVNTASKPNIAAVWVEGRQVS